MAYTLNDFLKLNPDYKSRYDAKAKTAYVSNSKTGKEVSFGLGQGQQYGLGAVQNGSHLISDPGKLISALSAPVQPMQSAKPKYESPYSAQIGDTLAAIQKRPSFNYDPSKDVGLQSAQTNAMDAVSRSAARRNMLYSDSNKSQMGQSALALVPQFEQTAFNRYQNEGQDLYSQLQALSNLENQQYGMYRDTVGDARYADELSYGRGRDVIADQQWGKNFNQSELQRQLQQRTALADMLGVDPVTSKPTAQNKLINSQIQENNAQANKSQQLANKKASNGGTKTISVSQQKRNAQTNAENFVVKNINHFTTPIQFMRHLEQQLTLGGITPEEYTYAKKFVETNFDPNQSLKNTSQYTTDKGVLLF